MKKLKSWATGLVLGAGGMYAGLQYHVLLTHEGFLTVPRAPQHRLQDVFADVQDWDADAWAARPQIARAVTAHGRGDLLGPRLLPGILEKLRLFPAPDQPVPPEKTNTRDRQEHSEIPAPIPDGKVAKTADGDTSSVRSVLPLAELFGLSLGEGSRDRSSGGEAETDAESLVLPAGTARSLEVEFLPPPDAVDLGQPEPFPGSGGLRWRQTDTHSEYGLPGQRRRQAVKLIGTVGQAPA